MKLKLFALLSAAFIVSGCGLTDKVGGADTLLVDDSFRRFQHTIALTVAVLVL